MIDPDWFIDVCCGQRVDFYTGVPDSLLRNLCLSMLETLPHDRHVIAANEGTAIGIAIGHYLRAGTLPLVYLQNSGFGNAVNPLLSLADREVYGIPMLVLVGWRGQPGGHDEPQHVKQGRVMAGLLDVLELPWAVLPADRARAGRCLRDAVAAATGRCCPYVLLVEPGTFGRRAGAATLPAHGSAPGGDPAAMSREEALIALTAAVGDDAVLVSTTGMLSRELSDHRRRSGAGGRLDFLTIGGMGHASSVALGIAMREAGREVWCLDGDGALLMHLGALPVVARHAPATFYHAIFNNGVHDSVGGQPTAIGMVDLRAAARALGYRHAASAARLADVPAAVAGTRDHGGPSLLELPVRPGSRPDTGRPAATPGDSKREFMTALGQSRE